jgi:sugar O-acyltransferase (sialic acid O-acetyltransferase NeuD family)
MKDLIIIGAGGSGMDIVSIIQTINRMKNTWNILGFLDDSLALQNTTILGHKVLGNIKSGSKYEDSYFVSSIAHPTNRLIRQDIISRVKNYTDKIATIIHPSVIVYSGVSISPGCVINAGCVIGSKVSIGENVHIGYGCHIAHETVLSDNVALGSGVNLSSGVVVGLNSYIGAGVSSTHDVKIAENILVAVGSAVVSDIEQSSSDVWIGIPALPMKEYVKNKMLIRSMIKI